MITAKSVFLTLYKVKKQKVAVVKYAKVNTGDIRPKINGMQFDLGDVSVKFRPNRSRVLQQVNMQ